MRPVDTWRRAAYCAAIDFAASRRGDRMRRREFITALGGAAETWPVAAKAQQGRRIGVLMARAESDPAFQAFLQVFRRRIHELGWRDGDNVRIDYRWTAGIVERFRTGAKELVALRPDVILADATPSIAALRGETQTIPIVFVTVNDPLGSGFIASFARPGGTITGFTNFEFSLGAHRMGSPTPNPRTCRILTPSARIGGCAHF